jgi:hypothetical protein
MMRAGQCLPSNTGIAPLRSQHSPVPSAAWQDRVRPLLSHLSRAVCLALTTAGLVAGPPGISFAASLPASELTDWDISAWSVTSVAACAVVLTKAGYLGNAETDKAADLNRLAQGMALDALSKATDPEVNRVAWETPVVNLRNDAYAMMQLECADLFKTAAAGGLIPRSVLTEARAKAAAYMAANGLSP